MLVSMINVILLQSMNLPIEIIYMILNHICYQQPATLIRDISSYQTLTYVRESYFNKWSIYNEVPNHWIENDLMRYANNYVPIMLGVQPKFKNILLRCFTKTKEIKFGPSTINILWGLFSPAEREEFVKTIA